MIILAEETEIVNANQLRRILRKYDIHLSPTSLSYIIESHYDGAYYLTPNFFRQFAEKYDYEVFSYIKDKSIIQQETFDEAYYALGKKELTKILYHYLLIHSDYVVPIGKDKFLFKKWREDQ